MTQLFVKNSFKGENTFVIIDNMGYADDTDGVYSFKTEKFVMHKCAEAFACVAGVKCGFVDSVFDQILHLDLELGTYIWNQPEVQSFLNFIRLNSNVLDNSTVLIFGIRDTLYRVTNRGLVTLSSGTMLLEGQYSELLRTALANEKIIKSRCELMLVDETFNNWNRVQSVIQEFGKTYISNDYMALTLMLDPQTFLYKIL